MKYLTCHILTFTTILTLFMPQFATSSSLFGYVEMSQSNLQAVEQWTKVQHRHPLEDIPKENLPLKAWYKQLKKTGKLSTEKQLIAINNFANEHPYIIDMHNYGIEDYWAIVKEFLQNNGDCEDYAITKFYSLRELGFDNTQLRIVILQDTNLKVAHAVLAVFQDDDIVILDNQVNQILSHTQIKHYTPIYSINEKGWWLHLPPM